MKTRFFRTAHLSRPRARTKLNWAGLGLALCLGLTPAGVRAAGNWLKLGSTAPGSVSFTILLSDGTVMAANNPDDITGDFGKDWYRLTPDPNGHYVNGEWSQVASMTYARHAFAAEILPDGRLFVAGGEHPEGGAGEASAEIYDPIANGWTLVNPPAYLMDGTQFAPGLSPARHQGFVDCESKLRPDGTVLLAPEAPATSNGTLIYNPRGNTWSAGPASRAWQAEESWVDLPDGSILTVDADTQNSERYIPSLNQWIADAGVPVNLWASLAPSFVGETGPAFLLPNGKAFFLGGNGHTAIYTPSGGTNNGFWIAGPDIPGGLGSADAPAAMMPNGKILCAVSGLPSLGSDGQPSFPSPTSFFEYDYAAGPLGTFTQVSGPTGSTDNIRAQDASMLVLPDGSVLYCHVEYGNLFYNDFGSQLYVYVPIGTQVNAGKPTISSIVPNADGSFHLTGTGLNGISEGAAFGDDSQMNSNFPLVEFIDNNNGHMDYARTYNWSSYGVMTGNKVVTTEFTLPPGLLPQTYSVKVSASGITSEAYFFYSPVWVDLSYSGGTQTGSYVNPYPTLLQGINAVNAGGELFLKPGHYTNRLTISKAMVITAVNGTAFIGQ